MVLVGGYRTPGRWYIWAPGTWHGLLVGEKLFRHWSKPDCFLHHPMRPFRAHTTGYFQRERRCAFVLHAAEFSPDLTNDVVNMERMVPVVVTVRPKTRPDCSSLGNGLSSDFQKTPETLASTSSLRPGMSCIELTDYRVRVSESVGGGQHQGILSLAPYQPYSAAAVPIFSLFVFSLFFFFSSSLFPLFLLNL